MQASFLALSVTCGLLANAPAIPDAPLLIRSQAPLFSNRLSYTPGHVEALEAGRKEVAVGLSHVNTWAQMAGYFFDGEWTQLAMRLAYGLPDAWELLVELPVYGRNGGFLDGFIMGFHRAFGVTQSRRDRYPLNALRVETYNPDHVWLDKAQAGVGVGNPSVQLRKQLLSNGGWPALAGEATLKLPMGSIGKQFATPNLAILLDLALQQPLGPYLQAFVATGLIWSPGPDVVYGMKLAWVQKFLFAALQLHAGAGIDVVFQYMNQDGAAESAVYAPLNSTTHEFALGASWNIGECWRIEAAILENAVHDANTPDFGLHLGMRTLF